MNTEKTFDFDAVNAAGTREAAAPRGSSTRGLRRFVFCVGTTLLMLASLLVWRAAHPPLSDREQITAQIETMRAAVETRNAGAVAKNVGDDFAWNGLDARTFRASLAQAFLQWRDVKVDVPSQKTSVRGDDAATDGRYVITLREAEASAPQTLRGDFSVQWKRTKNGWRIVELRGGEQLLGTLQN